MIEGALVCDAVDGTGGVAPEGDMHVKDLGARDLAALVHVLCEPCRLKRLAGQLGCISPCFTALWYQCISRILVRVILLPYVHEPCR